MQRAAVLGSTGSIGTSALDVISRLMGRFSVTALSTHSNIKLLSEQVKLFRPGAVSIIDKKKAAEFRRYPASRKIRVYEGEEGQCLMLESAGIDIIVVGIVGSAALRPVLTGLNHAKRLALANKESLVMAGGIVMEQAKRRKVKIIPVDSEHSAVFQCVDAGSGRKSQIKNIYLTGSGGPLLKTPVKRLKDITPAEAVNHPKWKMGKKISVDSATMMNKGLEIIEAHHLFGVPIDCIKVLIHPEAIVHSMVEFRDGAMLAQLGNCDMRAPIQYALTYPLRLSSPVKRLDFSRVRTLNFQAPDYKRFPCLEIAYEAARKGETYPCVLNAANEEAVSVFLKGGIKFTDISRIIGKILSSHKGIKQPCLGEILDADMWARVKTKEMLGAVNN
ncbi:MAG: 1-deoxy-D-xylulose-5-phosphate reductoisomerase [Candidatus Omnitrophica bacterium]|nr:1-deoxy-D-xylulose-5-phosphate reductoisomerase [Candidatus Omnitrophota bacterium]